MAVWRFEARVITLVAAEDYSSSARAQDLVDQHTKWESEPLKDRAEQPKGQVRALRLFYTGINLARSAQRLKWRAYDVAMRLQRRGFIRSEYDGYS